MLFIYNCNHMMFQAYEGSGGAKGVNAYVYPQAKKGHPGKNY